MNHWADLSKGASATNPRNAIVKYGVSDFTQELEERLGTAGYACNALCPDVKLVVDNYGDPKLSTDGTTSSLQPPCTMSDFANDCVSRMAVFSNDILAFGHFGQTTPVSPKVLSVAGKTPTVDSVRNVQIAPANAYPLADYVYLNENTNNVRDPAEVQFFTWAFGRAPFGTRASSQTFENDIARQGFIPCTDPSQPGHLPLDCGRGYACP